MPSRKASQKQLDKIGELRDRVGQEHLVDALHRVGILSKRKKKPVTLSLMQSMTVKQAANVIKLLGKIDQGKLTWLRHKGIKGRYPNRLGKPDLLSGESFVYFISDGDDHVKIGKAIDVEKRISGLQTGNPRQLSIELVIDGGYKTESRYHYVFNHLNTIGDWFRFTDEIKDEIRSIVSKEEFVFAKPEYAQQENTIIHQL